MFKLFIAGKGPTAAVCVGITASGAQVVLAIDSLGFPVYL